MKRLVPLLILTACTPAHAQVPQCAIRIDIVEGLAERYGERQMMSGVNPDGSMVQIFANAETGTWTALIVDANGMACLVAAGEDFDAAPSELPANL